jgi:chromosome segregation ATPase
MGSTEEQIKALQKQLKDVKGAYTRSRQELSGVRAELETVNTFKFDAGISDDELKALKTSDPDAWKAKLTSIEAARQAALAKALKTASEAASAQARTDMLTEALKADKLSMDTIKSELPGKYLNDYEAGKIDEYELVERAKTYMNASKVLNSPTTPDGIDFSTVAGGSVLSEDLAEIADPNDSIV